LALKPIRQNSYLRLYDRLFSYVLLDRGGKEFHESLNPNSLMMITVFMESSLANVQPDQKFQVERPGNFVAERADHKSGKPVFNLA
jgi:glutaminyl-tRNA synthetase